jgi:hypothetical protein
VIIRTITVVGSNLFHVAAEQLGDPLQWANLAQENGLADPFLEGTVVLRIPAKDPAFADGIGAQ